jgi:hypothetical protein
MWVREPAGASQASPWGFGSSEEWGWGKTGRVVFLGAPARLATSKSVAEFSLLAGHSPQ